MTTLGGLLSIVPIFSYRSDIMAVCIASCGIKELISEIMLCVLQVFFKTSCHHAHARLISIVLEATELPALSRSSRIRLYPGGSGQGVKMVA